MQGQLAVQTVSHQLINHYKQLHYKQLSSGSSADAAWLEQRPELVHLRVYLGALAGLPDAADLDMLPDAKGDLVRLPLRVYSALFELSCELNPELN